MREGIRSRKDILELYIIVTSGWSVYATCQDDFILPAIGLIVITLSTISQLINLKPTVINFNKKFSWASVLSLSLLLGWVWITLFPRQYPADFIQSYAIFILQSGSIFLTLFLWFNPDFVYRMFFLRLITWLTVAFSCNVAFKPASIIAFTFFCSINILLILFSGIKSISKPQQSSIPKITKRHIIYKIMCCLITLVLFAIFVIVFKIGDAVYMRFMRDYTFGYKNHHFFNFKPVLEIQGPGYSGWDVHPMLEIDRISNHPMYLTAQYFERYEDGRWLADEQIPKFPLADQLEANKKPVQLIMFEKLKEIIPTPKGVSVLVGTNGPYEHDSNGIIYSARPNIHKVLLNMNKNALKIYNRNIANPQRLTQLDTGFSRRLRPYLEYITKGSQDPRFVAKSLEYYFKNNYGYSLNVNFKADDNGIIYMLHHKPNVYCSFFASAMGVLLREANIPSRLVVGFLATEARGRNKDKYLVRVRDAHAWVEALLPVVGQPDTFQWVRFDPTPPDARLRLLNDGKTINRIADYIWLSIVRFRTEFKNLESEKLLSWLAVILFLLVFIRNYPLIKRFYYFLRSPHSRHKLNTDKNNLEFYKEYFKQFEKLLSKKFNIKPKEFETGIEILNHLKKEHPNEKEFIKKVEYFLSNYHEARFGWKRERPVKKLLAELQSSSRSKS